MKVLVVSDTHGVDVNVAVALEKAGMVGADFAQALLPKLQNLAAQTVLPEEGAALPVCQCVVVGAVRLCDDAAAQLLPKGTGDGLEAAKALLVHVNFPAHTAGVPAAVSDAVKIPKAGQNSCFDRSSLHKSSGFNSFDHYSTHFLP